MDIYDALAWLEDVFDDAPPAERKFFLNLAESDLRLYNSTICRDLEDKGLTDSITPLELLSLFHGRKIKELKNEGNNEDISS